MCKKIVSYHGDHGMTFRKHMTLYWSVLYVWVIANTFCTLHKTYITCMRYFALFFNLKNEFLSWLTLVEVKSIFFFCFQINFSQFSKFYQYQKVNYLLFPSTKYLSWYQETSSPMQMQNSKVSWIKLFSWRIRTTETGLFRSYRSMASKWDLNLLILVYLMMKLDS